MGQAGSHPSAVVPRTRRANTLPHEPPRHAPKVLPSLPESPRLRSTDNGAILQSGGTISGRRPTVGLHDRAPHGHVHSNAFRSRSAGAGGDAGDIRSRERDPLHRSHTNLDLRLNEGSGLNKRFGSEPDLRLEEEPQKPKCNKHFRKKYRAPPPPTNNENCEGSSPDSSEGNSREPQRKLRLFKTRNETKKMNGHFDSKTPGYRSTEYKSLDLSDNQAFERRYRSPCKDKEQHLKYPDNTDMIQSTSSLKREERLLQTKQELKKTRIDRVSGCRAKMSKSNEQSEAWKTPLLNRNFRYSERFKKEDGGVPPLRREKTFDSLLTSEKESESPRTPHETRMKSLGDQLKANRLAPMAENNKPLRKSLPSLLAKNSDEKDEFQAELKKATSRIRNDVGSKVNNVSENKTSQNDKTSAHKPNPTKSASQNKVTESSLKTNVNNKADNMQKTAISRRPLGRLNETKTKPTIPQNNTNVKNNAAVSRYKYNSKENNRTMPDRGQASGKESTPEHSPTRKKEPPISRPAEVAKPEEKKKTAPSKQFYFGMIESKQTEPRDHLKDFPGLGSPIIEEISNFHLIEKKLLGYHDEDAEFEKFNAQLKENCKVKNLSSESALSSEGSEGESEGSLGIALRLRPTLPKKQPAVPRFSPAAAWRQLASLDAHLAAETQPLAVETKMAADISPESSPRSDQSADKSGDSGISGDHAHSDHRVDSPRHHTQDSSPAAWTPQQDLGDSSSDGAGGAGGARGALLPGGAVTYSPGAQPFSLSLPREDRFKGISCFYECFQGKQIQQGFNSLQKLRKSVSGALGAALGSRRFDLEHEPMLEEPEQNWFLTKSAPNSLSNPLLFQPPVRTKGPPEDDIKEESRPPSEKEEESSSWRPSNSYLSWGGHVMYLPPAPAALDQPLSILDPLDRPVRSKSSGCLEVAARAARAALASEMRERERSASPEIVRALPARVEPNPNRSRNVSRGKKFTFQSTVRQLERRRLAEKLSKEADLKEQQRRTELEAMRRVEEEFQRKRAREKANIRQQLRLVSGASSTPTATHNGKARDEPDGSCRESPAPERTRDRQRHSNSGSEISGRSKSTTPIRCVELSEWRDGASEARVYRDWAAAAVGVAPAHAHPPACARMPMSTHVVYNAEPEAPFSGSPRSDNYRLEFARGRSPRTPRPPRLLTAARSPSTSGSELSLRQPIKIRETTTKEAEEPAIVPTLRPSGPSRAVVSH
ncbi:uncharacterized protein LOC128675607 isoform X2 [Plodia interpunctella]|uniref:uncharacterized protein LOC128675607 isoform X2 n=1 Tax=Plodia interpunctella TaxID=58824 RepID=UPI00236780D6|nr:uncharacterized protein LOC128675607 isoform X2 [Plodia interpunctella]